MNWYSISLTLSGREEKLCKVLFKSGSDMWNSEQAEFPLDSHMEMLNIDLLQMEELVCVSFPKLKHQSGNDFYLLLEK